MRAYITQLFLLCTLLSSSTGFSLVSGQLQLGWASGDFKGILSGDQKRDVSGTNVAASLLFDPLPLVPVAVGFGLQLPSNEFRDHLDNKLTYDGYTLNGQLMAWSPISLFNLTPYAKYGQIFAGEYRAKHSITTARTIGPLSSGKDSENNYILSTSGHFYAIGLRYHLLPLIDLLLEGKMQQETIKEKKVELAGQEVSLDLGSASQKNMLVSIGLEVGF